MSSRLPDLVFGIRTNGALAKVRADDLALFDSVSISLTTLEPTLYRSTMGEGEPPDICLIGRLCEGKRLKANVVLCAGIGRTDLEATISKLAGAGFKVVNLREPYGQPHIGDPFNDVPPDERLYGMPVRSMFGALVTYWDVHWVEVESVNLYANGRVSMEYPITKGHAENGEVHKQSHWRYSQRHVEQWVGA